MGKGLELYKQFIDDLVSLRESVKTRWVKGNGWPDNPENQHINQFINSLSNSQKEILCQLMQEERDSGIHDILAFLSERINLADMRIIIGDIELPVEPFDSELHYDWVCRCEHDDWPDQ